jgi:hypothetical protein
MSRIFRSMAAGVAGLAAVLPAGAATGAAAEGCSIGYRWLPAGDGIHHTVLTIGNTGGDAIRGWTLRFTLPPPQSIILIKGATLQTASGAIVARDVVSNATVRPGASVTVQYQASGPGGTATGFSVNGITCT